MITEKVYNAKIITNPVKLNIKKTLDGNIIIYDHPKILIIVSYKNNKVIALPKSDSNEDVYTIEKRFMNYLEEKGIIELGSIQGGALYSSMEANIPESDEVKPIEIVIKAIADFIKQENEDFSTMSSYKKEMEDWWVEPNDEDSTELGEVPQEAKKGSIPEKPYGRSSGYFGYFY